MKHLFTLCICWFALYPAKAQTTAEEYIQENADFAQELMRDHQLPASLILAVAIHESAAGTSKIARHLNNHFGIKGSNSNREIRSAYRDYPSIDSSYRHFVAFLQSRTYFNKLFDLHDQYDYRAWARGIQRGGYARSSTWASKVIHLIEKYRLYEYDERPDNYEEPPAPVVAAPVNSVKTRLYVVKSGDNLSKIAKRFGTTVPRLMKKNALKSAALKPGQKLKL